MKSFGCAHTAWHTGQRGVINDKTCKTAHLLKYLQYLFKLYPSCKFWVSFINANLISRLWTFDGGRTENQKWVRLAYNRHYSCFWLWWGDKRHHSSNFKYYNGEIIVLCHVTFSGVHPAFVYCPEFEVCCMYIIHCTVYCIHTYSLFDVHIFKKIVGDIGLR